jgi:8-oxo-dGTP diphosphatase
VSPHTPPPRLRVSGLVVHEGRLLLVRQEKGPRTYWLLPGGGIHRGETLAQALTRELREECALEATGIGPPFALVETISPDGGRTRHIVQLIMAARFDPSAVTDIQPLDSAIRQLGWFLPSEVTAFELHPPIAEHLPAWVEHVQAHPLSDPPVFLSTGTLWAR